MQKRTVERKSRYIAQLKEAADSTDEARTGYHLRTTTYERAREGGRVIRRERKVYNIGLQEKLEEDEKWKKEELE